MIKSQGQLSNDAKAASKAAQDFTDKASDNDASSHRKAADAHYQASWKNKDAGNATLAEKHNKQARLHDDKARPMEQAGYAAADMARTADDLSKRAHMSAYGKDPNDLRDPKDLHAGAADAHDKASKMYAIAGNERAAKYHAAKSAEHASLKG